MLIDMKAMQNWNKISKADQKRIIDSVFCSSCTATTIIDYSIECTRGGLLLIGKCCKCGSEVRRVVESDWYGLDSLEAYKPKTGSAKSKSSQKSENGQTWQFIVELRDFKPRMWRRFQIDSNAKLQDFCYVVMQMFHCMGGHLHQLVVGAYENEIYYVSYEDDDFPDSKRILMTSQKVRDVFKNEKDKATLEYDFGDGWEFKITLEKTEIESKLKDAFALTLTGKGFGIIEDCGGTWGLKDIYEALKSGEPSENFDSIQDMEEWLESVLPCDFESLKGGGFDYFDIEYINELIEDVDKLRDQLEMEEK